jgi:hypothetical protein
MVDGRLIWSLLIASLAEAEPIVPESVGKYAEGLG